MFPQGPNPSANVIEPVTLWLYDVLHRVPNQFTIDALIQAGYIADNVEIQNRVSISMVVTDILQD